jgi:hypothetical protein
MRSTLDQRTARSDVGVGRRLGRLRPVGPQAAIAGMLAASLASTATAAEPAPLVLIASLSRAPPKASVMVMLMRQGPAAGQPVVVRGPAGSQLWAASADGKCDPRAPTVTQSLQVPADAPDAFAMCFTMTSAGAAAQLIATAKSGEGFIAAVSSPIEIAQAPERPSIWANPVLAALLSAAVGFAFGLASSWFQTWYDAWKQGKAVGRDAQKFIAETFFPELRRNADHLFKYLTATPEQRQELSGKSLEAPRITEALTGERFLDLCAYFTSISRRELSGVLRTYDKDLSGFNRWANRLAKEIPENRETREQELLAKRLQKTLTTMKISPVS